MGNSPGAISLVELHDARVAAFQLRMGGFAELEFTHLVVFHQVGEEDFDVWSHTGRLELLGVSAFALVGELAKDDRILDAEIADENGREPSWDQLTAGVPVRRIVLNFATGATVTLSCTEAQLWLGEGAKLLEKWSGPLTAPDL